MQRFFLRSVVVLALVLLVAAGLAWASYKTTLRRTYGAITPFVIVLTVVDGAGAPIVKPTLTLLDAETHAAADTSMFDLASSAITGNDQGLVELRFNGAAFEAEDWQLFWLFPQIVSAPRGLNSYLVALDVPGHLQVQVGLLSLFNEHPTMVPIPGDPDRQMFRHAARVMVK